MTPTVRRPRRLRSPAAGGVYLPVNPWHPNSRKTHCRHGHPYDAVNTYRNPSTGKRQCRTCNRDEHRAAYWRARS